MGTEIATASGCGGIFSACLPAVLRRRGRKLSLRPKLLLLLGEDKVWRQGGTSTHVVSCQLCLGLGQGDGDEEADEDAVNWGTFPFWLPLALATKINHDTYLI